MTVTITKREWRAFLGSIAITDSLAFEVSALAADISDRCRNATEKDAVEIEGDCHVFSVMLDLSQGTAPGRAEIMRAVMAVEAADRWDKEITV